MQTFPITPIRPASQIGLGLLVGLCLALSWLVWISVHQQPVVMTLAMATTLSVAALFAYIGFAQSKASVAIDDGRLVLNIPIYGRVIALDGIIAAGVARTDMAADTTYRPTWRTNGLSIPGFNLGWFRTRAAGKILLTSTATEAVVCPTTDGYSLVVSVADAEGLIQAVRGAATHGNGA